MANIELLKEIEGSWHGTSALQLSAAEEVRESTSFLMATPIVLGRFLQISYTWVDEDQPQEGLLLVGYDKSRNISMAVWLDSWHTSEQFMHFEGSLDEKAGFNLEGSYSVASGPDWGWRITLQLDEKGSLQLTMYNISPDGDELWAVKGMYKRT